jgi:hypothetical protein
MSVCSKCTKSFASSETLNRHLRSSRSCGTGRLRCDVCNKDFSTEQMLTKHLTTASHTLAVQKATPSVVPNVPVVQNVQPVTDAPTLKESKETPPVYIPPVYVPPALGVGSLVRVVQNVSLESAAPENIIAVRVKNEDFLSEANIGYEIMLHVSTDTLLCHNYIAKAVEMIFQLCIRDQQSKYLRVYCHDGKTKMLAAIDVDNEVLLISCETVCQNYLKCIPSCAHFHVKDLLPDAQQTKELMTGDKDADAKLLSQIAVVKQLVKQSIIYDEEDISVFCQLLWYRIETYHTLCTSPPI